MRSPFSKRATMIAWWAIFALALVLVSRTLVLIYELARPMPYWDAWEFMKALPAILDGRYTLGDVFAFHNEHRIVTTRLLMLADVHFFAASGYLSTSVLTLLLCVIGCLLAAVAVGRSWLGAGVAVLMASLLFSVAQSDNYASGFQVQFPLVDLSAIAAIGLFALACSPGRSPWFVVGAIIGDALAVGSMASGNIVVGSVILVGVALRAPVLRIVIFAICAAAMTAAYLVGYPKSEVAASHDLIGIAHFAVNFLGSTLRGIPGASLWLGAGLLTIYAAVLADIAGRWWKRDRLDPVLVWLAGIAAYIVMGALVTATGRLSLGLETSVSSRYAIQSLLFACCVFLMCWRLAGHRPSRAWVRIGLATACVTISAVSTLATEPMHEWRERVAAYDTAGFAFASGLFSDDFVTGVYPRPELIRQTLAFMAGHRLGPFSERYADIYRPPLNAIVGQPIATMPACTGNEDTLRPAGPHGLALDGWVFQPDQPAGDGWVFAFDAERRLLGVTRQNVQRPDVAEALHIPVSRVGYRLGLDTSEEPSNAPGTATVVLVPDGTAGIVCRAATIRLQAN